MPALSRTARGDARRAHILAAARDCFLANGFHATSMQDLLTAAAISAGAFYRYFPSKAALVMAIADTVITELGAATRGQAPDSLAELLRNVVFGIEALDKKNGTPRLAVMLWGEAQRDSELAAAVGTAFGRVVDWYEGQIAALQARGVVSKQVSAKDSAHVATGIVQGFMVQRALIGIGAAKYCRGLDG